MNPAAWRQAARTVLGTHGDRTTIDASGLSVPQMALVSRVVGGRFQLLGTVTLRCHTCGDLITKPWEAFYVDTTPGREWASQFEPPTISPTTTTHHASHMEAS